MAAAGDAPSNSIDTTFPPPKGFEGFSLLAQGAEGRVYEGIFVGVPAILKIRFRKKYRHPDLDDKLRRSRTMGEARGLVRCRKLGLPAPVPLMVDAEEGVLVVSKLEGVVARQAIEESPSEQQSVSIASSIGRAVWAMHSSHLVHGDLTTSNFMVLPDAPALPSEVLPPAAPTRSSSSSSSSSASSGGSSSLAPSPSDAAAALSDRMASTEARVAPIDLGLCSQSHGAEDKAVDLYVLKRALDSTHPSAGSLWDAVLKAYAAAGAEEAAPVLARYEEVQMRGRKRLAFG